MGIRQRLNAAMAALRDTSPPERQPGGLKKAVFSFPDWLRTRARWNIEKFPDFVEEGYRQNPLIYAPIRYKARALASVPLVAATGDPDNPEWLPAVHPLSRMCKKPNPFQTWRAFNEQRKTYLELAGNAYVYASRERGGAVKALYNLRPDRVRILPDAVGIKGYYYMPPGQEATDGIPLLPEDVAHTKYPNPLDELEGMGYGLPPILSISRDADTDNSITAFIKLVFERGAMPMGLLRFETTLTDGEADNAKRRFMDKYGGSERWIEPVVMDQGGGYERIGMTFDELGFDVLDARNEARILMAFGVPPILLGTRYGLAHGTYSNYNEARTQFWQDVLVPELRMFEEDDQRLLQGDDGAFVLYDLSVVPALQADTKALVESAERLVKMGVPVNIALPAVGLTIKDVPGGDVGYIPNTWKPLVGADAPPATVEAVATEPVNVTEEDEGDGLPDLSEDDAPKGVTPVLMKAQTGGWAAEKKASLWKALDDIAISHEEAFGKAAAEQFELDRRAVLVVIGEARQKALRTKATINWQDALPKVIEVINGAEDRWREAFAPVVRGVVTDVAGFWNVEVGLAFDVTRLEDQAFFIPDYTAEFWGQISRTSREEITGVIQRGMRDGWSISEMQDGLGAVFDQWITGSGDEALQRFASGRVQAWRTELIARTESTKATSAGSVVVYRGAGVKRKEWLSTSDNRTRPTHITANGQIRPIDEPFDVGGYKMNQPGDSSLGAPMEEIGNCRCTVLPVIGDDEVLVSIDG